MFYRHSVGSYERIMPRNAFWLWPIFSVTETEILSKKNAKQARYSSWTLLYYGFSHDLNKIQTKKLSILLIFYFLEVLQYLNNFIYTNFAFQRVLLSAIEDAWISRLLRDVAFAWLAGKLLCGLNYWFFEILLSKHSLSYNEYYFNVYKFLKLWIHA